MPSRSYTLSVIFALLVAIPCCIIACKKPAKPGIDYSIVGQKDVALDENGSVSITLDIKHLANASEQVGLSLEGLPKGLSHSFNTQSASPPFKCILYLKDDSTAAGVHELTLKGHSALGTDKEYKFKVTTLPKTCASKAAGLYRGTSICRNGKGLIFGNFSFWTDSNKIERLIFNWNKVTMHGTVDCNRKLVHIHYQPLTDYYIRGTGYLDRNWTVIDLDYTEYYKNGDTISCSAHFEKL